MPSELEKYSLHVGPHSVLRTRGMGNRHYKTYTKAEKDTCARPGGKLIDLGESGCLTIRYSLTSTPGRICLNACPVQKMET